MWRRLTLALVTLVLLTGFFLELHIVIPGHLRGETFYRGRPKSYWRAEILRWEGTIPDVESCFSLPAGYRDETRYVRSRSWLERLIPTGEPLWPTLLDGDPEGTAVLLELAVDSSEHVRVWAFEGLLRMHSNNKGPILVKYLGPESWRNRSR